MDFGTLPPEITAALIHSGPGAGSWIEASGMWQQLAIEHTGDVYSCDHYVEPGYLLGNIGDRHLLELVVPVQVELKSLTQPLANDTGIFVDQNAHISS